MSTATVRRFRDGANVNVDTFDQITETLEGVRPVGMTVPANEQPADYGEGKDPTTLLVEELRLLAAYLESPNHSKELKGIRFSSVLDGYVKARKEYLRLIKEVTNNRA